MKYKILESEDKSEAAMVSFDIPEDAPQCIDDTGNPLSIVKVFEAETWNEAMQVYYDHWGFGEYIPMRQGKENES